ncbi:hypothetical protein GPJ56_004849 [Histomonas meleagridis]|uniref:uncharacterized protein n=1 Tax=Histomonas meleagridis TaxID=135588 RepID=UPI003559ADEC|nr:hypothetical protein GPJ56_004849 [Histomonas meleagridis]KAH0803500.1 hypothetical protein GO595_003844 [Histomonas meleagridis]
MFVTCPSVSHNMLLISKVTINPFSKWNNTFAAAKTLHTMNMKTMKFEKEVNNDIEKDNFGNKFEYDFAPSIKEVEVIECVEIFDENGNDVVENNEKIIDENGNDVVENNEIIDENGNDVVENNEIIDENKE